MTVVRRQATETRSQAVATLRQLALTFSLISAVLLLALPPISVAAAPASAVRQYTITNLGTFGVTPDDPFIYFGPLTINISGHIAGGFSSEPPGCGPFPNCYSGVHAFLLDEKQTTNVFISKAWGHGINQSDALVGELYLPDPINNQITITHAFLNLSGTTTDLGPFDGTGSSATAVNLQGQVLANSYTNITGVSHAFVWQNGTITGLGTLPGATRTSATSINDQGQVVGLSDGRVFLWDSGRGLQDLGFSSSSNPVINNKGSVAGTSSAGRAFLWNNRTGMRDLGAFAVAGLNDSDQLVGYSGAPSSQYHAVLYSNSQLIDLNTVLPAGSGWPSLAYADGINNSGQIVGRGIVNRSGGTREGAFLLTSLTASPPVVLLTQPARLVDTRSASGGGPISPSTDRCFAVAGQAGIPADAVGAVLNVTAAGHTSDGWLTLYPAGQTRPTTSTLNFGAIEYAIANGTIVRLGGGGQVCVNAGQTAAQVILDVTGYVPAGGVSLMPLLTSPVRLVDTRSSGGPIQPGADRCFTLAGQGGIPADAAGVLLNMTAAGYTGNGWLTVYPGGQSRPATSTLNYDANEYAIANGAMVKLGNGQVCVDAGQTSTHAILDAVGYITADGLAQIPLLPNPQRLVDTRTSSGPVQPGADRCFTVGGVSGIPADALGLLVNVTAAGYTNDGWLTLYPAGQALPATSTLNFDRDEYAIANGAIVRLGTGGQVCVDAGQTSTQVIIDVTGYLPVNVSAAAASVPNATIAPAPSKAPAAIKASSPQPTVPSPQPRRAP